jgi:hypothetical protein
MQRSSYAGRPLDVRIAAHGTIPNLQARANAVRLGDVLSAVPVVPIRGTLVVCCACVANGRTAAQPATTLMKSRRLIRSPRRRDLPSFECPLKTHSVALIETFASVNSRVLRSSRLAPARKRCGVKHNRSSADWRGEPLFQLLICLWLTTHDSLKKKTQDLVLRVFGLFFFTHGYRTNAEFTGGPLFRLVRLRRSLAFGFSLFCPLLFSHSITGFGWLRPFTPSPPPPERRQHSLCR